MQPQTTVALFRAQNNTYHLAWFLSQISVAEAAVALVVTVRAAVSGDRSQMSTVL
jgi:hypothetical protein